VPAFYTVYTDVNTKYLGDVGDKVAFTSSGDAAPQIESAGRIIRARLGSFIDATYMSTWIDTTSTPEFIQEIAAKLAAALQYRRRASEDVPDAVSAYAQQLYDEAMADLQCILDGDVEIVEVGLVTTGTGGSRLSELHFYPNDTVCDPDPDGVKFEIGMRF
jgi:hypothetical protein